MTYTKDNLRQIFQQPFNQEEWQKMLRHYFHATELKAEPERINDTADDEKGFYLGAIETTDNYRIGLFYYQIQHGNVARKRVGLRNLVKSFINPNWGEFDAALVVFDSDTVWRLSFVSDIKGESTAPKRYTYVFGENDNYYNTPVGRFDALQRKGISFENIKDAFSVERLNKDFFNGYKERYVKFLKYINDDTKENRDYVKKLLGRIVFLQFLQKKGWMGVPANQQGWNGGDKFYLNHLIERYEGNDRLLSDVLEPLFFNTLNERRTNDLADSRLGDNIKIPYLNGGLFDKDELDKKDIDFPYDYFKELMDFFAMYNFTIDENDPEDSEIGIDPEMLGHIFENLLEDNKDKGAFYTPKEIVQYMSEESIAQYLKTHTEEALRPAIDELIKQKTVGEILQNKTSATVVYKLLKEVKVCDPAIGSGAFPMGVLNVLYHARLLLYGFTKPTQDFSPAEVKREIIQNNIYGVDIEKGAIDIARLRFWLSIVVDSEQPEALPNFDYKFMQGNSLLEQYKGVDLSSLTHKKTDATGMLTIFEDMLDMHRENLRNKITEYFVCSEHDKKTELKKEITDIVKLELREQGIDIDFEEMDLSANSHFFLWHTWFNDVFDKGGFDVVIGNPPYIKEGRMSKTFFEPYKDSTYYKGKMDIWYLFACNGLDLLNENGILCFIATNNWVTSFGASKLRNKVIKETRICNIIDFGAVMMFESASIQTMIMLFQKDNVTDDYSFDYRRLTAYKATEKDAAAILSKTTKEAEYFSPTIRRANFIDKNITFSRSADIIGKIESLGNRIFLQNKELTNGIHPHFDFINKKLAEKYNLKIGEGVFGLNIFEVDNLNLTEKELQFLKPYYNSSDSVYRYYLGSTDLRIIYTTSSFKNPNSMDNYPHLKKHLDKYQNVITSDNKPYGLHRSRVETFFKGEKIVALRKCADKPLFAYANGEHYMSATFYVIKTDRVNMKYLTGLLNSRLIEFWLKNKGKMQGANYQLDKEPLMQIPIAVPNRETQDLVAKLVEIIILLKSSKQRASNLVTNDYLANEFSHIIDGCVYEIYFPNEMLCLDLSIVPQLLTQTEGHPIDLESVWQLYSAIDKSGIIESIKSLSLSKSEVLRTISLS